MNSIRNDILTVTAGLSIIAFFSTLLYRDFTTKLKAEGAIQIGTVTFKQKTAYRKLSKQVIWESVDQNSPVYNNDAIRTQEMSEAIVHLNDGTDIGMEENTMIMFSQQKNKVDISFEQGSIYASRTSSASASGDVSINAQGSTVSLSSGEMAMSKAENADLNLKVSSGEALFSSQGQTMTVGRDQALFLFADTKQSKLVKYDIQLNWPENAKRIITTNKESEVQFDFTSPDAAETKVEISDKRDFANIVFSIPAKKSCTAKLANGNYFWRVRGVMPDGSEGTSEARKLLVIQDSAIAGLRPSQGETIAFDGIKPSVNFRWLKNNLATNYILEISSDEAFSAVLKKIQTRGTGITVDDLAEGVYFWRVSTVTAIQTGQYRNQSIPMKFTVSGKAAKEKPQPLYPEDKAVISKSSAGGQGLIFSWKHGNSEEKTRIIISSDEAFGKIIYEALTSANYLTLKQKLYPGTAYWKICKVRNGINGEFSASRSFRITESLPVTLNFPANNSVYEIAENEKVSTVAFGWTEGETRRYKIEIAKDVKFLSVSNRIITDANAIPEIKLKPGSYFWKVTTIDVKNNEITPSIVSSFFVYAKPKTLNVAKDASGAIIENQETRDEKTAPQTTLEISTDVKNAEIFIDGAFAGKHKISLSPASDSSLSLQVKAKGYQTYKQKISMNKGETRKINIVLKKDEESRVRWISPAGGSQLITPIVTDKLVISSSSDRIITASSFKGNLVWKFKLDSILKSSPAVANGKIFTADVDGNFYCIDIENGKLLWKNKIKGPLLFGAMPLVVDDNVYFATTYGYLYSFSVNGKLNYEEQTDGGVYSTLSYYPEKSWIIAGTDQETLTAFSVKNGSDKWTIATDGRIAGASPLITGSDILIPTQNGTVSSVNLKTQKENWKFKADSPIASTPQVKDNLIFFTDETGNLYALNLAGNEVWRKKMGHERLYSPFILDNLMYIASTGILYSINLPESGAISWSYALTGQITTSPAAIGNNIYVGLKNGNLCSIKENIYRE